MKTQSRAARWPRAAVRLALLGGSFGACVGASTAALAQTVRADFWAADGPVYATALSGNILYMGGDFTRLGPATGGGVPIDAASGAPVSGFPKVVGKVDAVVADGAGGWFIGGAFSLVGGLARANLAHVLANNTVASWNPGADGEVFALALSGSTLYAGGAFTHAGGQARNRLAALDTSTGLASSWDPNVNNTVRALTVGGTIVYAGGEFDGVGGVLRNRIAAIDAGTGIATAFDANSNGVVHARATASQASTPAPASPRPGIRSRAPRLPRSRSAARPCMRAGRSRSCRS